MGVRKPPISRVEAHDYGRSIGLSDDDVEEFYDHHQSRGWMMRGQVRIVDGKAALRTWKRHKDQWGKDRARWRGEARTPAQPISQRNMKINKLNDRKAWLLRQPQTRAVQSELESIRIQLHSL